MFAVSGSRPDVALVQEVAVVAITLQQEVALLLIGGNLQLKQKDYVEKKVA